ncbi:MAG: glutathione S-transferase family protein [Gammaproteobacteria bacterium]|nr:glutathione S-transferase family protein [Gammaproteobacteria bacterium]
MPELEIIGLPLSNYVRSIRMLCVEKGVAYTLNPAMPHSADAKAIHPAGQVPCLRHGDLCLFESKAIATYIDKAFDGPRFLPGEPREAGLVEQWVSYGNAQVDRYVMREFVVPTVFADKQKGPDTARINAALPKIETALQPLESALAGHDFLVGERLTYADINLLPMLATFAGFPQGQEMLSRFPNVSRYVQALSRRDSFVSTAPPSRGK